MLIVSIHHEQKQSELDFSTSSFNIAVLPLLIRDIDTPVSFDVLVYDFFDFGAQFLLTRSFVLRG